jgi:hypothetical protein
MCMFMLQLCIMYNVLPCGSVKLEVCFLWSAFSFIFCWPSFFELVLSLPDGESVMVPEAT